MDTLPSLLVFCQALGALIGAVWAVWGEIEYLRAIRDGHIDKAERRHLDALARGLRFGMALILLASLGLVISAYSFGSALQPALTASYWSFILLALLIILITWALSRSRVSFAFGSAALFTAWWLLVYLTFGRLPPLTLGASIALYVVATGVFYMVLRSVRSILIRK